MQFYVTVHQDGIGTVNKSYKTANIIARNENEYIRGSLEYFEPFDICITSRRYSSNTESVSSRSFFEKFRILTVPGPNQKHGKKTNSKNNNLCNLYILQNVFQYRIYVYSRFIFYIIYI